MKIDEGEYSERDVINSIAFALDCEQYELAGRLIRQMKGAGSPSAELEILRVRYFLRTKKLQAALEAAKEAARGFPDDVDAEFLLKAVESICPPEPCPPVRPGDEDFRELYAIVRPTTMLSGARLYNLYRMAKKVCLDDLPGNFAECGVAGGGSTLLMALVIKRHSKRERKVFAFDTFEGMPEPDKVDVIIGGTLAEDTDWSVGTCAGSLAFVEGSMKSNGVADYVVCVPGLFEETLEATRGDINELALLHADGDWYQSIKTTFEHLYDLIVEGGLVQIDDYGTWDGCAKAIDEFFEKHSISHPLVKIHNEAVWFVNRAEVEVKEPEAGDSAVLQITYKTSPSVCNIPTLMSFNERYQMASVIDSELPQERHHVMVDLDAWAGNNLFLYHLSASEQSVRSLLIGGEDDPHALLEAVVSDLGEKRCKSLNDHRSNALLKLKESLSGDQVRPDLIFLRLENMDTTSVSDVMLAFELLVAGGVLAVQACAPETRDGLGQLISRDDFNAQVLDIPVWDETDLGGSDPMDTGLYGVASRLVFLKKL